MKSGTYDLSRAHLMSSPTGRTRGPSAVMFSLSALPATSTTFFLRKTPITPSASSPLPMHPNAESSHPRWVRSVSVSTYLARRASPARLDMRAAAPPRRNRQLTTSMDRSLPMYQLLVMFSWLTTRMRRLGRA